MSCNIKKCKAGCCGFVPIPERFLKLYKDKIERIEALRISVNDENVVCVDKDQLCIFLSKVYKCTIYENRPEICRIFGEKDAKHPYLMCPLKE